MNEEVTSKPSTIVDREANDRYEHVIQTGKEIFAGSAIIDPTKDITSADVSLIDRFHKAASPTNPNAPWRLTRETKSLVEGQIVDPSFFNNWEAPGGPLESINLASQSAAIIVDLLKGNLKSAAEDEPDWVRKKRAEILGITPEHAAAAGALHDEGREVTHLFYTNEVIGSVMLKRMGVRADLVDVLPAEDVMLVPSNESMDEKIQSILAETVIVRIADEFGKRYPGSNRLYQPNDYDTWDRQAWANGYLNRPFSGRPSDLAGRQNMQLHVDNVPRYFQALDNWVQGLTTLTLDDLTTQLNQQLSPTLPPLN